MAQTRPGRNPDRAAPLLQHGADRSQRPRLAAPPGARREVLDARLPRRPDLLGVPAAGLWRPRRPLSGALHERWAGGVRREGRCPPQSHLRGLDPWRRDRAADRGGDREWYRRPALDRLHALAGRLLRKAYGRRRLLRPRDSRHAEARDRSALPHAHRRGPYRDRRPVARRSHLGVRGTRLRQHVRDDRGFLSELLVYGKHRHHVGRHLPRGLRTPPALSNQVLPRDWVSPRQ